MCLTILFCNSVLQIQKRVADVIAPHLTSEGVVAQTLQQAFALEHVMVFSVIRSLNSFFALVNRIPKYDYTSCSLPPLLFILRSKKNPRLEKKKKKDILALLTRQAHPGVQRAAC
jgi:hypothetical protein